MTDETPQPVSVEHADEVTIVHSDPATGHDVEKVDEPDLTKDGSDLEHDDEHDEQEPVTPSYVGDDELPPGTGPTVGDTPDLARTLAAEGPRDRIDPADIAPSDPALIQGPPVAPLTEHQPLPTPDPADGEQPPVEDGVCSECFPKGKPEGVDAVGCQHS